MFFGALLGAVFGLMGSIASIMGVVEGFTEKIQGKLKNNEKRNSLRKSRNHLISGFRPGETEIESESFNKTEVQFTKVFPFETNAKINTFF